jgi:ribosome maturation factor RimP
MKRTEKPHHADRPEKVKAGVQGQSKAQVSAQAIIERIADEIAVRAGLEIVEVELKGAGRNQLLRITIDKPASAKGESVTHTDCETVSREVSEALDADDPIAGPYQLEVTSPGVERKLKKWQDWERFRGEKAKIVLKEPAGELKHFDGVIARTADDRTITVELAGGSEVTFPFEQVDRANLRFEW